MKKFILTLIFLPLVASCDTNVEIKQADHVIFGMKIYTIILDGNEYYYTIGNNGSVHLCPKLPPKIEK